LVVGAIEPGAQIDARLRDSKIGQEGRDELDAISKLCRHRLRDRIKIDPPSSAASNITPARSTRSNSRSKPRTKKAARPLRLGRRRGRYDGLVSRFRGEPVPATGFSIGVSRLQAALTMLGKLDTKPALARSSSRCSEEKSPTIKRWSRRFATRTSAPSCILEIQNTALASR
jgi:histidyl-tRNA synthetase